MIDKQTALAALEAYRGKCNGTIASTVAECIGILREIPEDGGWIPVGERLPEEYISVLAYIPGCHPLEAPAVKEAHRVGNRWDARCAFYTLDEVTHWKPMPEPPKEET